MSIGEQDYSRGMMREALGEPVRETHHDHEHETLLGYELGRAVQQLFNLLGKVMASVQEVKDSQAAERVAIDALRADAISKLAAKDVIIADLTAQLAAAAGAATAADLDGFKAAADDNAADASQPLS